MATIVRRRDAKGRGWQLRPCDEEAGCVVLEMWANCPRRQPDPGGYGDPTYDIHIPAEIAIWLMDELRKGKPMTTDTGSGREKRGINMIAADWWAERWQEDETRYLFKLVLVDMLPAGDWETYSDYDPQDLLLEIVRKVKPDCRGMMFSSEGILPTKTGLKRMGNTLLAKEGYGNGWHVIYDFDAQEQHK